MHQFSIIVPTFNRAEYLPRIYNCLCQQEGVDFEWIIINDGSSDNTEEVVSGFQKTFFEIKYIYQENSGQKAAMNNGILAADSYIAIMFDDEDLLYLGVLKKAWDYFDTETKKFNQGCVCLAGLFQDDSGKIFGHKFPRDYFVSDHIRYRQNKNIRGDKCEFYLTEILKKYPFPVIKNEKNIQTSIVWNRIAMTCKTLYINQIFGEKQFLARGLSNQKYPFKYPIGSELYHNEASIPPFSIKLQIFHSAYYIFFAKRNKRRNIFYNAKNKIIFPLGFLAHYYIILKYKNL